MQFVLNELIDIDSIAKYPGYEDATPDLIEAILTEAGKVASDVLAPLNKTGDEQGSHLKDGKVVNPEGFPEAFKLFSESGWMGLNQPTEFGGQGLPYLIDTAVSEMWHGSNMAFTLCPLLTNGAVEAIYAHASDELKQTYLSNMIEGKWTGTMNLTEPQAGTDLAAVRTKATSNGDHYLIKGQKIFITWGDHEMTENIIHLVLARLPDAPDGVKGISLFLVPKYLVNSDGSIGERNDARAVSLEHKMGIHASPTCVMSFGDNDGAIGYLVGEENNGLACMFTMMNRARLAVGTTGIQSLDLMGRKLMRDKGAGLYDLLSELKEFNAELQTQDNAVFASMIKQFDIALIAATDTTDWVLANAKNDPNILGAAGVNMMMMLGTTLGGWLLAKSAIVAQKHVDQGTTDDFYHNKITTAQFYAEQILPRSVAYASAVISGHESVMGISTESF
ncbi:UNVERIFIED_CONTAM: hypothetical protein GTU68_007215 [Idotea baltica]|nr:hypothetical protein [Idotea baltica]